MVSAIFVAMCVTCVFALLTTVYSIANEEYPDSVLSVAPNRHVAAALYVCVTVAASLSLWEAWKATVVSSGGF